MSILNTFPMFLSYNLLAPFILRLVVGFTFLDLGIVLFKNEKERWLLSLDTLHIPKPKTALKIFGIIEIVGGIMLLVGFYTQIAAIVLAFLTFTEAYVEYKEPPVLKRSLVFYTLIFAITLSLLFSGAGAFAIDLPL